MATLSDKEHLQINNIVHTLLEATEHFHTLVKNKEVNQSIFIFSSMVDGFEAIRHLLPSLEDATLSEQTDKMEKHVLEIARLLEQGNLLKINEMLQFSFQPLLKKISTTVDEKIGDQDQQQTYSIGVFASFANPLKFYPEPRVEAMVQESERQQVQLLFFTSDDVDFNQKEITADVCNHGDWQRVTAPFPDVINNVGSGKRSHAERKLRRLIPFMSFHVGNKFSLPKRIVQYRKYAELLVPFRVCRTAEEIHEFIESNHKVVFKALSSNRGENIFFVTKKGNRYAVLQHKKERIFNQDAFHKWVQTVILRKQGSFIVQRYIHTRTKDNEPFHIRAHVQKNGEGEWELTHIYPRVGNKRSNLSNVVTDGKVEEFHTFLIEEYGEHGIEHEQNILRLSLEVAHHLDKLYDLALDELGLDFAIDENGRYWMHEANNGPQTAYHEEKRAVNTIAYAKYIAKNGIAHTENVRKARSNTFQANYANFPLADLADRPTIGILTGKIVRDKIAIAMVRAAKEANRYLYSFTPQDIDYDEMLIRGYFYENGEWIPKIVAYPDVIFDRFKHRGDPNAKWIYEELEEIPFTNEWPAQQHKRSEIYESLLSAGYMQETLAPFQTVTRTSDFSRFLEEYEKVLLKLENGSLIKGMRSIEKRANGKYLVASRKSMREYSELSWRNKLKDWMKQNHFIVQQDTRSQDETGCPFTVHVHLIRNGHDEWERISWFAETRDVDHKHHKEDLPTFLKKHYGETAFDLEKEIDAFSTKVASTLKAVHEETTELALKMAIGPDRKVSLLDVDPNGPEMIYDADVMATKMAEYADYLLTKEPQLD